MVAMFSIIYLKAQTAEQTLEWLKAQIPPRSFMDNYGKTIKFMGESCDQAEEILDGKVLRTHVFNYSKIRMITYLRKELENIPRYNIVLTGDFQENEIGDRGEIMSTNKIENTYFSFKPTIEKEEIQKIVKALKHMATLKGAKLVNDDLF